MKGDYMNGVMIPLLMLAVLAYYGFRLLVLHDVEAIRGKNGKKLKDPATYAKEAGKLILFLAAGSLAMAVVLYWSEVAAFAVLCIWIIVFGILWKRMNEKYGEEEENSIGKWNTKKYNSEKYNSKNNKK